jgi:hypothetical protein
MKMFRDEKPPNPVTDVSAHLNGKIKNKKKLGDQVERIAQPIAKTIDHLLGTNIQGCSGCKRRKEALNKIARR